jgi:hypothetical protein
MRIEVSRTMPPLCLVTAGAALPSGSPRFFMAAAAS